MIRLDAVTTAPQYLAHLEPVWLSLPARLQGVYRYGNRVTGEPVTGTMAMVASYADLRHARVLGYRRFVYLEHGAGQSYAGSRGTAATNPSYAGGADHDDVELFLVPNEHSRVRWQTAYPGARVVAVGSPRLELLPARIPGPGPAVAISTHWNGGYLVPELLPAFAHYREVLPELVARYTVIGHGHPRVFPELTRLYSRLGIRAVPDFADVCREADVYVCDNSSTLFEFAATGRPVVVLNCKAYRRNVHHGLRFWEAAEVGLNVDRPEDLLAGVELALQDPPERLRAREAALDIVYAVRDGSSVARAVAAVTLALEEAA